jgi:Signal transduction histidine kinase
MHLLLERKKLFVFSFLFWFAFSGYVTGQERFLHFTEVDGLPRNITTCMEQDQYGYLWIGTTNGIARYNGKEFYTYKELSGFSIISLLYDSHKTLWTTTTKGLFKYNRLTNNFELVVQGFISKVQEFEGSIYFIMMSTIFEVNGNKVEAIYNGNLLSDFCFSKKGLWLATSNDGVRLVSKESGYQKTVATYLRKTYVTTINEIDDNLFVGCYNGQLYSVQGNGSITKLEVNNHYFPKKFVKVGQEIWLATDGFGIIVFDKNLNHTKTLSRNKNTDASINSNSIYDIFPGNSNEVWLASYGAGLTCILPDNLLFQNILPEKGNENSLISNEGTTVFVKKPIIYLGTNYGLSEWNEHSKQFKNIGSTKLDSELKGTKVTAICSDDNNLWIGTYDGLLGKYSSDFKLLKTYHPSSDGPDEMQRIVFMQKIEKNRLLILTQFQSRILLNFHTENEKADVFELGSKGSNITYFLINSIRRNQHGEILALISDRGLYHVNSKDNILENRLSEINKRIDSYLIDFYQDKKGCYWFASSSGLIHFSKDGKSFKKYTVKEGLPSNNLARIETVDDRYLWISSVSGICRFDMETGQALNFNHSDGLPANEFLDRSSTRTDDGRMIFGSLAGFTFINPSKFNPDALKTKVIISDITFQNQSIRNPESKPLLKQPLEDTREITLPYNKNSFSIHFFAKNKSFPKYHNYAFRLLGFEKDWTYLVETNYANYTNLNPGMYTFEIKTADRTKEGTPTRLIIQILSPWYLRWYAYLIYITLFFTILYLSIYAYLKRVQLKKEKEVSEFMIQKEHELTEKKLSFFTNISHDLKTPLTLIDAPVNDLLQSSDLNQEQLNKLKIINRNSKRLYKLITDLLDFRKITQNQYVLEVKETRLNEIIWDISEAFKEECKHKSIDLKCNIEDNLVGFIDSKKIEKIIWNLLSNALKFTSKGGKIILNAEKQHIDGKEHLKILISDNGIGIAETDKDRIFDRFFKVQSSDMINKEGTGIGLSIVKELVEIHHGTIQVESSPGTGTAFAVLFPCCKECFSDNEQSFTENKEYQPVENETSEDNLPQDSFKKQYNLPVLLLLEDNAELREYLAQHFEKHYKVFVAEDGLAGLEILKEIYPDIILTDVEMPNMNGYEFCKEIRRNFDSSHLPVIMLTANNTVDQQIEGLSLGADIYMTKPFDIKLLDAQINTLLENRRTLRNKFLGIEGIDHYEKTLPQKDIDFIQELKHFIEENMINQDLSVELLSQHFAVSLAQLHRKIKSLTGSTPNNLIKSIRLKRAYKLISEGGLRVSEAAYQTGFNDPNYFTICFKKEFGENPSQIATAAKESQSPHTYEPQKTNLTIVNQIINSDEIENNYTQLPLLLIAEDDAEMQTYIYGEFAPQFRITLASDGLNAFELAVNEVPDFIISDIMMPSIDGIELCKRLKTDERTSHIPIILLTAKNTEQDTLAGLENGADDYIPKPFNTAILKARVRNLYQSRLLLRSKFLQEPEASLKEISSTKADERFLKKACEIVEKHIENTDFDVQILSSELGMSRAQLYRKIDAVSGQSVNEFIRIVRLKKAAELLANSDAPISEIVEKVGFNSFAYFTKSFREYFGVTPSKYKQ